MYSTRIANGISIKTIKGKDYYCFEDIIREIEKSYFIKTRGFFESEIFKDSSKNTVLSKETYEAYKRIIDEVVRITTEEKESNREVPYADFWHWLIDNGGVHLCPKTKTFNIELLIKKAEIQEKMQLNYWYTIGKSSTQRPIMVSNKWIIEGILNPIQKKYGNKLRVYFSKWCY